MPVIHNHDIMNCTNEGVRGNWLYSARGLGLTHKDDIIQIHPSLQEEWPAICAHYDRVGLEHTENVIWDVSYERLADYPEHDIAVFFFDELINRYHAHPDWMQTVIDMNSKNSFMQIAGGLGVPIPQTLCYATTQEAADLSKVSYPCYVKAAISVAGKGIFRCTSEAEVRQALASLGDDVPVQIQEEVNSEIFLNMQYRIKPEGAEPYLSSVQVLDGFTHMGNRYPYAIEPWEAVDPAADWMFEHGMKGVFAFDVAVIEEGDETRLAVIECNPRYNGASYPTGIAHKLHLPHWYAEQFSTSHKKLNDIDLSGIEFDPETRQGVVIVNWGPVREGVIGFLLTGTPDQTDALRETIKTRL